MTASSTPADQAAAKPVSRNEIVITREFDAPRALVFQAWSKAEHLVEWWAPQGATTPYCTIDFRVGGKLHFCMRLADGRDIWGFGHFREIVFPERIVYLDAFADAQGNPVPPTHYGFSAAHPAESLVTVTFAEHGGSTRLTLRHAVGDGVPEQSDMRQGWNQMFDKLATLAGKL
jgi:uncharacterized protein YndB with AHSA1/START domain